MNSMPGSQHVLRTLDGVRGTPYSVERMFRSEARLVTIQSMNSVRPSIWLTTEYEQHPGISYQYRVQIWYSVHNTTAHPPPSQHALQVIQMVISIPTDPPGVAMCSVRSTYTVYKASGWWNRIIRRGNGWIHDIHRCWRLVDSYSVCKPDTPYMHDRWIRKHDGLILISRALVTTTKHLFSCLHRIILYPVSSST